MKSTKLREDVPTMSAGSGQIAGIGVGNDGEPGVDMKARKKKWKQDQQKSELHLPKEMISSDLTEGQKPLDIDLWAAAQEMAKDEYPDHPTPDSTKFAINWYLEHGGEYASNTAKNEAINSFTEDLRKWFGSGKTGGVGGGGWDRYNTKGERIGKCGDAENRGGEGEGKPKCLSKEKAAQLRAQGGKQAIANAVKRKKAQDSVTDRKGTGSAPRPVSNRIGESMLSEKNVPTKPELWSRAKSEAKKRFDVYPSAYANGWAAKWYKKRGGRWKTEKNEAYDLTEPSQRELGIDSSVAIFKSMTPGEMQESSHVALNTLIQRIEKIADKHDVTENHMESRRIMREFKQGKHVVLLAVPKNPNDGDGKGYWKVGTEVYRGLVKNAQFDASGAPMDRRWESSFSHFARYFDGVYGQYYKKAPSWTTKLKEAVALTELISLSDAWEKITTCQQCKNKLSPREQKLGFRICDACVKKNKGKLWGKDSDDDYVDEDCGCDDPVKEALSVPKKPISRVVVDYMHGNSGRSMSQTRLVLVVSNLARPQARSESAVLAYLKKRHPKEDVILLNVDFLDSSGKPISESVYRLEEAEYQGREVTLGKPFRTPNGPKKFSVYVKNDKGNVVKVSFGDPNMEIKRDDPDRRKAYRNRHNCDNPGPRWKAEYWSCRMWSSKPVSKITEAKVGATLTAVPKDSKSGDVHD